MSRMTEESVVFLIIVLRKHQLAFKKTPERHDAVREQRQRGRSHAGSICSSCPRMLSDCGMSVAQ